MVETGSPQFREKWFILHMAQNKIQCPPSRMQVWSYRLHKSRECFFQQQWYWCPVKANCVTGSLWEPTGTPTLLWSPLYPFRRTTAGVRGDISFLFCPFLFLFPSLLCLYLHPFSLFFVSFFLPSSLFHCLLFGGFVSSLSPYLHVYLTFLPCFLYIFLFKPCLCFFLGRGVHVSWVVAAVAG